MILFIFILISILLIFYIANCIIWILMNNNLETFNNPNKCFVDSNYIYKNMADNIYPSSAPYTPFISPGPSPPNPVIGPSPAPGPTPSPPPGQLQGQLQLHLILLLVHLLLLLLIPSHQSHPNHSLQTPCHPLFCG